MRILISIILILLSFNVHSQEWTVEEKAWGATTGVLLLGD